MIFYAIYTSTPSDSPTPEALNAIAQESIKWNKPRDITGMLLGLEDKYVQFLEGDEKEVKFLLEKIKKDPRHSNIIVRVQGYADRVFTEWSMGSWMLSNNDLRELKGLEEVRKFLDDPLNNVLQSKRYLYMMDNLLQTWIEHETERAKKLKK